MATFYGYNEEGLEFLYDCTNEQLDFLVQLITTKGNLSETFRGSCKPCLVTLAFLGSLLRQIPEESISQSFLQCCIRRAGGERRY